MNADPGDTPGPVDETLGRDPRRVPALRALAWYAESMRLWKKGPATFAALAFVTLVVSIAFEPVPILGFIASNVIAPLIATSMLYEASPPIAATDRACDTSSRRLPRRPARRPRWSWRA